MDYVRLGSPPGRALRGRGRSPARRPAGASGPGLGRAESCRHPPIVGASKSQHLDDAVAALSLALAPDEIALLEAPYTPHPVVGFN